MLRFRPASRVSPTILYSGEMILRGPSDAWSLCPPETTAMWLALQEQGGDPYAAADRLANVWESSPVMI